MPDSSEVTNHVSPPRGNNNNNQNTLVKTIIFLDHQHLVEILLNLNGGIVRCTLTNDDEFMGYPGIYKNM